MKTTHLFFSLVCAGGGALCCPANPDTSAGYTWRGIRDSAVGFYGGELRRVYHQTKLVIWNFLPFSSDTAAYPRPAEYAPNTKFWDGLALSAEYNRPFWADVHSTLIKAEAAWATNSPDYDWADIGIAYRPYVFSSLGADLPVWSGNFANNTYGLSVTLPFFIEVWLDMFERTTAPVVNTGYRFGVFEFGFIHRFREPLEVWKFGIKNYSLRISPLKHECAHIGDELTIHRKDDGLNITRVNVSYNYAEFIVTLNDPDGSTRRNHGIRFGMLMLHNWRRGYYDILPQEADPNVVEPSHRPFEFWVQYQHQSKSQHSFQTIGSLEIRQRERYNYPFSYSGFLQDFYNAHPKIAERWQVDKMCVNIYAGIRYNNPKRSGYFSKIGIGWHFYFGINPYGQFRSQPNFSQMGLSLIFE